MKFSDINEERWPELAPYMDTCLLPVTGLTGKETPWKAVEALEQLRDAMAELEKRYVGRIVTYPAFHFLTDEHSLEQLSQVILNLKESAGFTYVVLITADPRVFEWMQAPIEANLFLNALHVQAGQAIEMVSALWYEPNDESKGE